MMNRICVTLALSCPLALPALALADDGPLDYDRDIRPILSDACYACHGPDPEARKSELRLDRKADALLDRDGIAAIVPGDADASELVFRIETDDETLHMPPSESGKALKPGQAELLRRWVVEGANWSEHWGFIAPERPAVPAAGEPGEARNPIDRFVLERLGIEDLSPSPEADRATLIRRLSLDLIGLPPTIAEVDTFLDDDRPDAYERLVDRLIASPRLGERWGRAWLDAARYADSDGYEKDKPRNAWAYRDWVIDALNSDLPYDRFLIAQVAGDLLPGAGQDDRVATGFLRNSMVNEEGGVDPEQFRMEAMFDRMDAIGKAVLGLTINCAQCHTHKYDPLTHIDYYRMFAYLNDTHEANVPVYSPHEQMKRAQVLGEIAAIEADLKHRAPDWAERMATWEDSVRDDVADWLVVQPHVDEISTGGQRYLPQPDGSFLAAGYAPTHHTVELTATVPLAQVAAFRLEQLTHPELPLGGPGRSVVGTSALTEFRVEAAPANDPRSPVVLKITDATADVNPPETPLDPIYDDRSGKCRVTGPIGFAIDGKDETAWGIDVGPGRRNRTREAVFVAETPAVADGGIELTFHLKQNHGGWNSDDNQTNNLGRFRLSVSAEPDAKADPLPAEVRAIVERARSSRTPAEDALVFSHWRTTVPGWDEANARIEALWDEHPEGSSQLALRARTDRRETHRLERGDFLKPAEAVEPGVPGFLHPMPADAPTGRLGFAHWLADRNSPTTARSIVNRIWQADFGRGLVATPDDFGSQGEAPSHPELLDWLAVELMDSGWSLKHVHRLIVTSTTYRQSSRMTPEGITRDPDNRLLARGPRFRAEAEVVRDVALAASGLLSDEVGGPSVFPPAPSFLFEPPASYGPKTWDESTGPDRYRRALYTFRFRSTPYPMLEAFDAPNGDVACVRRARSNTPLQALTTLNEPMFLECSRALARLTILEGGDSPRDRMTYAFRRCLGRPPVEAELNALIGLLNRQADRFRSGAADPMAFAAPGDKPLPKGVEPAELASWTAAARVLLNLDETITKE